MNLKQRLLKRAGLDAHVIPTLLFRGWSIISGVILLVLLPLWLTPAQLGYHYTFASILGLQIFFELGMNQVVSQIASHESAHLASQETGQLSGDSHRVYRLSSLYLLVRGSYQWIATLFLFVVGSGGILFFARHQQLELRDWLLPWLLLIAATSINIYLGPRFAILEGLGQVSEVARFRLKQSMVGSAMLVLLLLCEGSLWASAMPALVTAMASCLWLRRHAVVLGWLRSNPVPYGQPIHWFTDIYPLQWRIALSWISGYFIFQLFTPLIFENQGPVEAGKFGITLAIFNAVQSVGMSWVYSKSPSMSACVARGDRVELNLIFDRAFGPSILFTAFSSVLVVFAIWWIEFSAMTFAARISEVRVAFFLAIATVTNAVVFALATYMRSHKREPMMKVSVFMAVLTLAIAHWASHDGVLLVAQLYGLVTLLVALPWTYYLYRTYRWQL